MSRELYDGFHGLPEPGKWLQRKLSVEQSDQEPSRPYVPYWFAPLMKILLLIFVLLAITVGEFITKSSAQSDSPVVYAADIRLSSSCTLADAIIAANLDRAEGDCPAGRGADTIALSQDITLRAELPAITSKITIEGGGYTISGDNRYRIFYNEGGMLTINNLTMTKGYVEGELITYADESLKNTPANPIGGAIVNWQGTLSISDSSFSGNSAWEGAAIFNWKGRINIVSSNFSGNSADLWGGAIFNAGELSISGSSFVGNSGAISNAIDGTLNIVNSNFSGNSADEIGGAISSVGKLSITNSTFSGNSADTGGAISSGGELSIVNSTFSDNSADMGGAIHNWESGTLNIINSIIASEGENACYSESERRLRQNIGNFIQDGSCNPAFHGDPMLGELVEPADGSPAYFPLLAGSRVIDAADDGYCPATDQIGAARPQGDGCDIGAIEYAAP